ncbi:transposase [Streptomyces pini]|uniref:transposase n=1 Tax=Streptomyces pini TaxID=1520580 RepID=UPI000B864A16
MGGKYTKRYTEEFKRDAIALVDSSGKTVTAVARELGISSESLRGWYRRAKADRAEGAPGELTGVSVRNCAGCAGRTVTAAACASTRSSATHTSRDQATASTRPRGITNECPRSRGNFTDTLTPSPAPSPVRASRAGDGRVPPPAPPWVAAPASTSSGKAPEITEEIPRSSPT